MDVSCLIPKTRQTALGLLGTRAIKRARRLLLILGLVAVVAEIALLVTSNDHGPSASRLLPIAALVALWLLWRQSCHHQRMPAWSDPVELSLVVLVGVTAGADETFGLLLVGLLFRSLFTGPLRTAAGICGYLAAYVLATLAGPTPDESLGAALHAVPVFVVGGAIMHFFGRSLERYDAMQQQLTSAAADRRMASIVHRSSDVVTVIGADDRITFQSPSVRTVLGYEPGELYGTRADDLLHPDDRDWVRRRAAQAPEEAIECRWRHRDGSYRLVQNVGSDLLGDPDVSGIVLTTRDITDRRALEDELKHRAFHDSLTGLPNRACLDDRLTEALASAGQGGASPALVLLDLDDFKTVNDSLGHAAGDRLLVIVARRLSEHVRAPGLVARLGGDEFALLVCDHEGEDQLLARVEAILDAVSRPITLGQRELRTSASAGVCLAAGDGPEELLRNADLALYRSKAAAKRGAVLYESSMHDAALQALELEADLRCALERDELELHFQPLFTAGWEIAGVEGLLRWNHPVHGRLAPGAFLETAERSGLIVPIGRWVLREACRHGASWTGRHPSLGQIGIGVNVSAEQLREVSLVDDVRAALDESGLAPHRLVLEITETVLMQDLAFAADILEQITAMGVTLALDDFGTGYSSLAYLQRLPLGFLKIPRPFVAALEDDPQALALARGIVSLGASLGLGVVAEGVETERQRTLVHEIGCRLVQGFLLARPMPADQLEHLLAERETAQLAA